ncbi:MAG TPA: large conductance mechanosensitive channel protein MscL [Bacillales bacterium]|nr:large conductance mechanosensitive channel protein MscL [Bacillales bacterium]
MVSLFRLIKEFKQFAKYGNMVDMSIGMVIGAAFGKIIDSLVQDIIMPPIGFMLGDVNFTDLFINLSGRPIESVAEAEKFGAPTINYGLFLNTLIRFIIIMFVVFLVVRQMNRIRSPKEDPITSMTMKQCPRCYTDIPYRAERCPHCTSYLPKTGKIVRKPKKSGIKYRIG